MSDNLPEQKREKIRQKELEKNPLGSLSDGVNRGTNGHLTDLTGGLNWRVTGSLILLIIFAGAIYLLFFK